MGMIWVGVGDPPGNDWSGGSVDDVNRLGSWLGATGQSNGDHAPDITPGHADRLTAQRLGQRVAGVTSRWLGIAGYQTERLSAR